MSVIYLAGGCFWGVQKYFDQFDGIIKTTVGYANGHTENPKYEDVKAEKTGHVETVKIEYDESLRSLNQILDDYYKIIDPTSLNKQGEDEGISYRTGIYYTNESDLEIIQNKTNEIQKKYTMKLSSNKTLVIRLDGKDVTKDENINFLYSHKGSFLSALKDAAKYFSKKYGCFAYCGTDEISFILENPKLLFEDIQSDTSYFSQETISVFSEYFYDFFINSYKDRKIFWHAKCFSIPTEKINSYIKYREKIIQNVIVTYFLKKNNIRNVGNEKLNKRIDMCKTFSEYKLLEDEMLGNLFYNGDKIDVTAFINDSVKVINETEDLENNSTDVEFDIDF